jgi:serine/threonine protein kinase
MASEESLDSLSIAWKGTPADWHTIPRHILPLCSITGEVRDSSGHLLFTLKPYKELGSGTFGHVDAFYRITPYASTTVVAMKRPKNPNVDVFIEALFQWKVHNDLREYGLSYCIPRVFDIFRYKPTDDVWFTMEAFEPLLVSRWCMQKIAASHDTMFFGYLMLQLALILEVFENELHIDHRDLKVNNMLILEEKTAIQIQWEGVEKEVVFPFRVIILDFGLACFGNVIGAADGLPTLDPCPKEGRDIFQVLVSLWSIQSLRTQLEPKWGAWVRQRIESAKKPSCLRLTETSKNLDWMHSVTADRHFRAPLCAPWIIIRDCLPMIEELV